MGDSVQEILDVLRKVRGIAPMVTPFLPPPAAAIVGGAATFEPVIEEIVGLVGQFTAAGADHTGAVASVGTILQHFGQQLMTIGVLSQPPATDLPTSGPTTT